MNTSLDYNDIIDILNNIECCLECSQISNTTITTTDVLSYSQQSQFDGKLNTVYITICY